MKERAKKQNLEWIEKIISKDTETNILCETKNFILFPHFSWEDESIENLYCLAFVKRQDILSVRDLSKEHVPLLEEILENGTQAILSKFKIEKEQIRVFVHYIPSIFRFHVHFCYSGIVGGTTCIGRAIFLEEIIENLKFSSNFYQTKTMIFSISDENPFLMELFLENI